MAVCLRLMRWSTAKVSTAGASSSTATTAPRWKSCWPITSLNTSVASTLKLPPITLGMPKSVMTSVKTTRAALIKVYRWRPQEKGEIAAYQKFWVGDPAFDKLAQPLLVYADLLDQGDGRSLEVARMIHDQYLRHA
jgi:hypothetical protein